MRITIIDETGSSQLYNLNIDADRSRLGARFGIEWADDVIDLTGHVIEASCPVADLSYIIKYINPEIGYIVIADSFIPKDSVIGLYSGRLCLHAAVDRADMAYALGAGLDDEPDCKFVVTALHRGNITRFLPHLPSEEHLSQWIFTKAATASTIATGNIVISSSHSRSIILSSGETVSSTVLIAERDIQQGEVLGYDYNRELYWEMLGVTPKLFDKFGNLVVSGYQSRDVYLTVKFSDGHSLSTPIHRDSLSDESKSKIIVSSKAIDGITGFCIPNIIINRRLAADPREDYITFVYQGAGDEEVFSDQDLDRLSMENNAAGLALFRQAKYKEAQISFDAAIRILHDLFELLKNIPSVNTKCLDELKLSFASIQYNKACCIIKYGTTESEQAVAIQCLDTALITRQEVLRDAHAHPDIEKVKRKLIEIQSARKTAEAVAGGGSALPTCVCRP